MSQTPPSRLTNPSSTADRRPLERCIDELAELARTDVESGSFFAELLSRMREFGGAESARLWRQSSEGTWEIAGRLPAEANPSAERDVHEWLTEAANQQQSSTRSVKSGDNGTAREVARTLCPIVHASRTVGLLDATLNAESDGQLPPDIVPFLAALSEIAGDFLLQTELRQLRQAQSQWQLWDQFTQRLIQRTELRDVAATIVNDGRLLAECDRLTLLCHDGSRFVTTAVTGVDRIEPRSNSVRTLESIAELLSPESPPVWFDARSSDVMDAETTISAIREYIGLAGTRALGLIPFSTEPVAARGSPATNRAVLVVEQFRDVTDFAVWRSRAERLAARCELPLMGALDREAIPFYELLRRLRHAPHWLRRPGLRMGVLFAAAIATALVLVPVEFTVTGSAELVPDHRRDVFASTSGIVDQLLVKHGDEVQVDQPVVVLHDPQLALDLPKIAGEIDVVRERLKGVLAARLTGGSTPDAANRARQLTAEEEELKERQKSLERQRTLIEQQQAALTLRSPIRGKVLTWDVATLLSARPVERGQALLSVGDTDGPWVIEIRVADKDFGHIRRARQSLKLDLDVECLLASDPRHSLRGTIRDVAETTQYDDRLGNSVTLTVAIDSKPQPGQRAGATVIPRIRCGRQSLGYVWLHDLIDAIRTRLLF